MRGVDSEAARMGTERKKEELNTSGMWVLVLFKNNQTDKRPLGYAGEVACVFAHT